MSARKPPAETCNVYLSLRYCISRVKAHCPQTTTGAHRCRPLSSLLCLESCARLVEGADHAADQVVRDERLVLQLVAPVFGEMSPWEEPLRDGLALV